MSLRIIAFLGLACGVLACNEPTASAPVAQPGQFVSVTAGRNHACAIDTIGRAWCWGENSRGQTGAEPESCAGCGSSPAPVRGNLRFVAISAGAIHTCGLTSDGAAYCWGDNGSGQLGAGTVGVCISLYLCSDFPLAVVGGDLFKSITAGSYGTCGITLNDVLKCWGFQMFTSNVSVPTPTTVRLLATGDSIWSQVGRTDDGLNGCGIASGGVAACWGQNPFGQVGVGSITSARLNPQAIKLDVVVKSITTGTGFACALSNVGDAYCWGRSDRGGLAVGADAATTPCSAPAPVACIATPLKVIGGRKFTELTVGYNHACGLDVLSSEAYCWGSNTSMAIGTDALGFSPVAPSPFAAGFGTKYVSLAAGTWFTCGLLPDKNISCWGNNAYGQLGQLRGSLYVSALPVTVRTTP